MKLTGKVLMKAIQKLLSEMEKQKQKSVVPKTYHGKQTVKQLVRQGAGVSNIEITDHNIKSFERVARKYGVDFALKRDNTESPPKWLVFFKGKDTDVLTSAFSEFAARKVKRARTAPKPSVLATLAKYKEIVKNAVPDVTRNKQRGGHEL